MTDRRQRGCRMRGWSRQGGNGAPHRFVTVCAIAVCAHTATVAVADAEPVVTTSVGPSAFTLSAKQRVLYRVTIETGGQAETLRIDARAPTNETGEASTIDIPVPMDDAVYLEGPGQLGASGQLFALGTCGLK